MIDKKRVQFKNISTRVNTLAVFLLLLVIIATIIFLPSSTTFAQQNPSTKNVYARATDAQIDEAQKYYRICSENPTLNKVKNCKCAAAEYLETRLRLGNRATADDIIEENLNSCLRNPDEDIMDNDTSYNDPEYTKIPNAYLEEAENVQQFCKNDAKYRISFECDCLAAEFLEKRMKLGPTANRDQIMVDLRSSCRNIVEKTGHIYSECMSGGRPPRVGDNITQKEYCECYAREWSVMYKNFTGNVDRASIKNEMKFRAIRRCSSPTAYKK